MKKIVLSLTTVLVLMFNFSYSQWVQETAPITTYGTGSLYSVFAISPNDVAASGDGRLIVSCDGGTTWTDDPNFGGWYFYSIHTMDSTKWYSICQTYPYLFETYNPCGSYNLNYLDTITGNAIHFRTLVSATIVGAQGKIDTTIDGGITWHSVNSGTTFALQSVWYADSMVGVAVGLSAALTRTTDGGAHWTLNQNINTFFSLYSVQFPTPTTGYVCGALGTFMKSTDAGATWNIMPTNTATFLNGVYFVDSLNGYVVGDSGKIMKTTDGANTWTIMPSGTLHNLRSVNFINPDIGWIVGDDSIILKLDLTTGTVQPSNETKNINVSPNPANNIATISIDGDKSSATSIKISDITGRTIQTIYEGKLPAGHNTLPFDVSTLSNGLYFIKISNDSGISMLKFLKD